MEIKSEIHNQLSIGGKFSVGYDGSAYQVFDRTSAIDWRKPVAHGVEFIAWRMSVGGYYKDKSFIPNMVGALEQGIRRRCAYVVVHPGYSLSSHMALVEQQMRELRKVEGESVPPPIIALDVEINKYKKNLLWRKYEPKVIAQRVEQVADEVREMQEGVEGLFYTYPYFVTESLKGQAFLKRFRLWIAYYYSAYELALLKEKPHLVPEPWKDETAPLNGADIYQFSSEINQNFLGKAFGSDAVHVDLNRSHLKGRELDKLFNLPLKEELPEPQTPEPVPSVGRGEVIDECIGALEDLKRVT